MSEHPAIESLRANQTQIDDDGCMVAVSRQALEETLANLSEDLAAARRELVDLRKEKGAELGDFLCDGYADANQRLRDELDAARQDAERLQEDMHTLLHQVLPYIHDGSGRVSVEEGRLLDRISAALVALSAGDKT
jgi:chromosome segregation ATPase